MLETIEIFETDIWDTEDYGLPPNPLRRIALPVSKPNGSVPYVATDVQGIGPVKASINTSTYANWDGGIYQNSKVDMRNIRFTLQYKPDYAAGATIQDLRRDLYRFLAPGDQLELRLTTGSTTSDVFRIKGVVESMEPMIFSRDPAVTVSIICPDSYFRAPNWTTVIGKSGTPIDIPIAGTAPTGFTIFVFGNAQMKSVSVANGLDDPIVWRGLVAANQQLRIATERGRKEVTLRNLDTDNEISRFDMLESGGLSMQIGKKITRVWVNTTGATGLDISLNYTPKFVGI